jgi:hypothetical protein
MKKEIFRSGLVAFALLLITLQAFANHLDGLWRNDRQNITVRIEGTDNGIRAKRIDQGIWYNYTTSDDYRYTDRNGNYYQLQGEDQIIWNEAHSDKRIAFTKVAYRDQYGWDEHQNHDGGDSPYDYQDHYGNERQNEDHDQPWMDSWYEDHRGRLDGRWVDSYNRDDLEIEGFKGGLQVRRDNHGWEKYFPIRYSDTYRDQDGNILQLIDHETLRWKSHNGRQDRLYHRRPGYREREGYRH